MSTNTLIYFEKKKSRLVLKAGSILKKKWGKSRRYILTRQLSRLYSISYKIAFPTVHAQSLWKSQRKNTVFVDSKVRKVSIWTFIWHHEKVMKNTLKSSNKSCKNAMSSKDNTATKWLQEVCLKSPKDNNYKSIRSNKALTANGWQEKVSFFVNIWLKALNCPWRQEWIDRIVTSFGILNSELQ